MTAHNILDCDIATRSNMMFDELEATMDASSAAKDCTRLVSQEATADCSAVPIAAPVSPCTTAGTYESDSSAAAHSITGRYSDITMKYHVDERVLGTGHHGSVREAVDRSTGKRYAVKTICKNHPSVKPGGLVREIMLLQEVKHESIVQLVDVFEDAEYVHLVTDLCSGGELFDKIVEKSNDDNGVPCFSEDEAAKIMYQILNAVSYMHRHGIVHRDIKPENILFQTKDEDSSIKIIDFGLARKHFASFGEPPMTTIVGTPYYIAPEVLRKSYTKSCDLWSVGVIAYILLCGYPPFNGRNNDETHAAVLRGRYSFPSREWKCSSKEARDFVRKLLQMDPQKRMTVEEALNHPWIVRHTRNLGDNASSMVVVDEERQDVPMVEANVAKVPHKTGSSLRSKIAKRRYRMSMFGI